VQPVTIVLSCPPPSIVPFTHHLPFPGGPERPKELISPADVPAGALGHCSGIDKPTILIIELAAFFAIQGLIDTASHVIRDGLKFPRGSKVADLRPQAKKGDAVFSLPAGAPSG
jgi:hypothetical protein